MFVVGSKNSSGFCPGQKPEEFFELTTNILADSWESKEGKQGIEAFFEKRPAPWVKKGENHG